MNKPLEVKALKESEFNVFVSSFRNNEVLFFNTRTGYFRAFMQQEWQQIKENLAHPDVLEEGALKQMMLQSGMLVPLEHSERRVLEENYIKAKKSTGMMLTITTSISCNFGCNYCFQSHSKEKMEAPDEQAILAFVEKDLKPDSYLSITWFGGEPLINFDFIESLCPKLKALAESKNCRFSHSIITNGYLLRDSIVERMKKLPPFSYVQITLDGGKKSHDQRRVLLSGKGTYDRILDNIERTVGIGPIHVRVNVDRSNVDQIEGLADDYFDRKLDKQNVHIYLAHTRPYTEHSDGLSETELSKEEYADLSMKFEWYLFQRGYRTGFNLPTPRGGAICTADTQDSFVISPAGRLFKCWNDAANTNPDDFAGLMTKSGEIKVVSENKQHWENHNPYKYEKCKSCKVQPLCKGGCPWEAKKMEPGQIGDCTPLKWNLPDKLRLYHMKQVLNDLSSDELNQINL